MRILSEREGDYFAVEIYSDDNRLLIRVGFDHEPTQDEIETLMQQLATPPAEVTDSGDLNFN
jgi:hypothetical protein